MWPFKKKKPNKVLNHVYMEDIHVLMDNAMATFRSRFPDRFPTQAEADEMYRILKKQAASLEKEREETDV